MKLDKYLEVSHEKLCVCFMLEDSRCATSNEKLQRSDSSEYFLQDNLSSLLPEWHFVLLFLAAYQEF